VALRGQLILRHGSILGPELHGEAQQEQQEKFPERLAPRVGVVEITQTTVAKVFSYTDFLGVRGTTFRTSHEGFNLIVYLYVSAF
jgi:hypothetical protein